MNRFVRNFKKEGSLPVIRKTAWIVTLAVAIGGQFYSPLGLLVPFIMLALMGMSVFRGRYWCGNYCPHGSFFDFILAPLSRKVKIPKLFISKIFIGLFFLFFMYKLSSRFVTVFQNLNNISVFEGVGMIFSATYLTVLAVGGLLALVFSPRTWCQFCPMGTIQTIIYKLGKATGIARAKDVNITSEYPWRCVACAKCARVCPMQLRPYAGIAEDARQFTDERCIRCRACIDSCPVKILSLSSLKTAVISQKEAI